MTEDFEKQLSTLVMPSLTDLRRAISALRSQLANNDVLILHPNLGTIASEVLASPASDKREFDLDNWMATSEEWVLHERTKCALREAAVELIILGEALPGADWHSQEHAYFRWKRTEESGSRSGTAQVPLPRVLFPHLLLPRTASRGMAGSFSGFHLLESLGDGEDVRLSDHVRRCLIEAVEANKRALPLAAGIMLGSASEGAWLELAEAIIESDASARKIRKEMDDPKPGAAKIQDLVSDYLTSSICRSKVRKLAISTEDLRARAEYYRTLRNYAHPHVDQRPVPDHENMSMAILEAARYFRSIYLIIRQFEIDHSQSP